MAFIVNESFASGSLPSGWNAGSTGDFGYATSPAPLEGSYSLRVDSTDTFGGLYDRGSEFAAEQWGHFLLSVDSLPAASETFFWLYDGSLAVNPLKLALISDGTIVVADSNAAHNATTASGISAATTYHVWWRYKPGSGANGEKEVWINTANNRAGTASGFHAVDTAGAITTGVRYFNFNGADASTLNFIVDTVQWADTDEFAGGEPEPEPISSVVANHYRQVWR